MRTVFVGGVAQRRYLQQHECELEHAPAVCPRAAGRDQGSSSVGVEGVVLATQRGDLGVDTLVSHHAVHEPETLQRIVVRQQVGDPISQPPRDLRRLRDGIHRLGPEMRREVCGLGFLELQPGGVAGGDRFQTGA